MPKKVSRGWTQNTPTSESLSSPTRRAQARRSRSTCPSFPKMKSSCLTGGKANNYLVRAGAVIPTSCKLWWHRNPENVFKLFQDLSWNEGRNMFLEGIQNDNLKIESAFSDRHIGISVCDTYRRNLRASWTHFEGTLPLSSCSRLPQNSPWRPCWRTFKYRWQTKSSKCVWESQKWVSKLVIRFIYVMSDHVNKFHLTFAFESFLRAP